MWSGAAAGLGGYQIAGYFLNEWRSSCATCTFLTVGPVAVLDSGALGSSGNVTSEIPGDQVAGMSSLYIWLNVELTFQLQLSAFTLSFILIINYCTFISRVGYHYLILQ